LVARFLVIALLFAAGSIPAFGWGAKGHEISARAAVNALPKDFPAFFLAAKERLVYLCPEPDRWKGGQSSPGLGSINPPDHYFDLEAWGDEKIPITRYDLLFAAFKRGIVKDGRGVAELGTAPVVIAEMLEKLTTNFRQWRDASPDTPEVTRQVEENIIYNAGVVAHYVTDLSNPLHTTVHHNGWAEGYPNPKGYPNVRAANGLHSRFESAYVDKAIDEKDIPQYITPVRRLGKGPWVPEMEAYLRQSNALVEQLYQLDSGANFGSGHETEAEHTFTLQRLAYGASMLRDVWNTAWLNSFDEWLAEPLMVYGRGGKTLLQLTRERNRVETQKFAMGELVIAIGNRKNGLQDHAWMYYVAGKHGSESADKYVPRDGERVEWRFDGK